MAERRKHSKIETILPAEMRQAIDQQLLAGKTYEEIADWIKSMGHDVSKAAVGRYGKDFTAKLERVRLVRDQAKAIIDANPEAPATELAEAASLVGQQLIMETLLKLDSADGEKVSDLLQALARLEASGVKREALKRQFNQGIEAAAKRIKEGLKAEIGQDPELMERLAAMVDEQAAKALQK